MGFNLGFKELSHQTFNTI